jgi:hypothetical protein
VARTDQDQMVLADQLEWVLPHYEASTTQEESLNDEVKRLQVLKSYMILDNPREEAFERITALVRAFEPSWRFVPFMPCLTHPKIQACRIFDVPIGIITLIDLVRAFIAFLTLSAAPCFV